jgi:hypothetical protein
MGLMAEELGFESQQWQEIFLLSTMFVQDLRSIHIHIQRTPRAIFPEIKL